MNWLLIAVFMPALVVARPESSNPFREADKWVEIVNSDPHSTWTARRNFNPNLPQSYIKSLLGLLPHNSNHTLPRAQPITDIKSKDIPATFDARKHWSHCKSLQEIRDQGDCGSCWAVVATSAFADRLCVASHGKINVHLSQEELLACCSMCGDGCGGGYIPDAWDFSYSTGCQPYSLKPCEHHVKGKRPLCPSLDPTVTPKCHKTCTNKKYSKPLSKDLHKGVYKHNRKSKMLGGHAVKLIGWGVEKGVKYWLVQNSWNYDWGDKGLFQILRGSDECGFESQIYGGIPEV